MPQTDQLEKHYLNEYTALVKDYLPSTMVEDKKKELVRSIEELKLHLLRKNTALMRAYCYDPLMEAYKELRMQVSRCFVGVRLAGLSCNKGNIFR